MSNLTFTQGNLLEADVEALVNTVNTVGIMGKGIALMFKKQFPDNFAAYALACEAGEVRTGKMFVTEVEKQEDLFDEAEGTVRLRWIINFPTKEHWRADTRIEWVEEGLKDLVRVIREKEIRSIAIPALGCGEGGLDWNKVRPLIESALEGVEGVAVRIYEPMR